MVSFSRKEVSFGTKKNTKNYPFDPKQETKNKKRGLWLNQGNPKKKYIDYDCMELTMLKNKRQEDEDEDKDKESCSDSE